MKNKKKKLQWALATLFLLLPLMLLIWNRYKTDHFSCEGEVSITHNETTINVVMHYMFNGGKGSYTSLGKIIVNGMLVEKTRKSLTFNYIHNNDQYVLISDTTQDTPEYLDKIITMVPDFFLYSDRGFHIQMVRENLSSYLFVQGGTPLFYCTRTDRGALFSWYEKKGDS